MNNTKQIIAKYRREKAEKKVARIKKILGLVFTVIAIWLFLLIVMGIAGGTYPY